MTQLAARKGYSLLLMASVLAVTIARARAWRSPNDWAIAHWLIGYASNAPKRWLVGTLMGPVLAHSPWDGKETIVVTASLVFALFAVTLLRVCFELTSPRFSLGRSLLMCAFLSSPYVVMSAHLNGYFDNMIVIGTVASVLALRRGNRAVVALLLTIEMLVHEAALLTSLPIVAFCMLMAVSRRRGTQPLSVAVRFFREAVPVFLLPTLVLLTIFYRQSHVASPEVTRQAIAEHLARFDFLSPLVRARQVPESYATTFVTYFEQQGHLILRRIGDTSLALRVFPTAGLFAYCTWKVMLRDPVLRAWRHFWGALLGLVILCPSLMQFIAWDTSRVSTYLILMAFLTLWTVVDASNDALDAVLFSVPVRVALASTLILNVVLRIRLVDLDVFEHFSRLGRVSIYVGLALLAAIGWRVLAEGAPPGSRI